MPNWNSPVLCLLPLLVTMSHTLERQKRLTSPYFDEETVVLTKYIVSIRSYKPQRTFGDNHFCVGSILTPEFVITAAICTVSNTNVPHYTRSLIVVAGTPNRLIKQSDTVEIKVDKVYFPIEFKRLQRSNVALLRLKGALPSGHSGIAYIKLPTSKPDSTLNYTVVGWGRAFLGGPLAGLANHIKVQIVDYEKCQKMLKVVYPETLCAGNMTQYGDQSPCAGDTGAPMIFNHTLVGIVAHRMGCGSYATPSLYTDVWYHMEWIRETLKNATQRRLTSTTGRTQLALLLILFLLSGHIQ